MILPVDRIRHLQRNDAELTGLISYIEIMGNSQISQLRNAGSAHCR